MIAAHIYRGTERSLEPGTPDWRTLHEVIQEAGISYRQLDYWCRQGYINGIYLSHSTGAPSGGGSGSRRVFSADEYRVAVYMGRLVNANLDVTVAAQAAREMVTSKYPTVCIAPGVAVTVWGAP